MRSLYLSTVSAALLAAGGLLLLFVPNEVLPQLVNGYPADAAWLGQLVGAGWLAVANLNWMTRHTVIGGLFGRPAVVTNVMLFFVMFSSLLRAASAGGWPVVLTAAAIAAGALSAAYGWLMFRGPFASDHAAMRR